jgi:membrane protein implicated in regulation of membrane protease activity
MTDSTVWWVLTGVAVAIEMVTGTFYLLMLAVGLAAAAIAAHFGASLVVQIAVAAVVGGAACIALHLIRGKPSHDDVEANRNINLDIGETVHVAAWSAEGTSNVQYRGANWAVVTASDYTAPEPGLHRVRELDGNRLVLEPTTVT